MACIYNIINTINGAVYVGSTVRQNPSKRWWRHTKDLRSNIHHSRHLQRAWNKYGERVFKFLIVQDNIDDSIVLVEEQKHLDNRKLNFPSNLNYNECWVAGNCVGRKFSQKTIQKLKLSHLGIKPSKDTKLKQSLVWDSKCKTPYSFTDETGVIHSNIKNLRRFSREHSLEPNCLKRLHTGKLKTYRGWVKTGKKRMVYDVLDNTNNIRYNVLKLKPFCVEHGINYKMIHKHCITQNRPYNNWMVYRRLV